MCVYEWKVKKLIALHTFIKTFIHFLYLQLRGTNDDLAVNASDICICITFETHNYMHTYVTYVHTFAQWNLISNNIFSYQIALGEYIHMYICIYHIYIEKNHLIISFFYCILLLNKNANILIYLPLKKIFFKKLFKRISKMW